MKKQVAEFLQSLTNEHGRSPNTIAAYRNDLTQFASFLQDQTSQPLVSWADLSPPVVEEYLRHLDAHENNYSSATVARKLAAIKRFCEFLHAHGHIEENFARSVRLPKVTKSPPRAMNVAEICKLLAEPAKFHSPQAVRDKALLETLYATGMRVSELVELDVSDVDLAAGSICCDDGGKHSRVLKVNGTAASSLERYLREARDQLATSRNERALFLNHRGQRLTRQGLWLIIKRYVQQVGIETPVTPHTLRHSFAAHLLDAGAALREIKERLGYAHLSSTQVYQQMVNGAASELVIDGRPVISVNGNHS
jgi:integrase/recombinase XerD